MIFRFHVNFLGGISPSVSYPPVFFVSSRNAWRETVKWPTWRNVKGPNRPPGFDGESEQWGRSSGAITALGFVGVNCNA